jgi:hypothetical protein
MEIYPGRRAGEGAGFCGSGLCVGSGLCDLRRRPNPHGDLPRQARRGSGFYSRSFKKLAGLTDSEIQESPGPGISEPEPPPPGPPHPNPPNAGPPHPQHPPPFDPKHPRSKVAHFKAIAKASGLDYADMVFYDNEKCAGAATVAIDI